MSMQTGAAVRKLVDDLTPLQRATLRVRLRELAAGPPVVLPADVETVRYLYAGPVRR